MFERFTERARQVVVLAQEEAREMKHNYIGAEHLYLGLIREEQGVAAHVLETLGIGNLQVARADILSRIGSGDEVVVGQVPFTPRAKKILETSLREALSLGHNYIGTEHVLLGVIRESNDGWVDGYLRDQQVDVESVRNEIIRMLSARLMATATGAGAALEPLAWSADLLALCERFIDHAESSLELVRSDQSISVADLVTSLTRIESSSRVLREALQRQAADVRLRPRW